MATFRCDSDLGRPFPAPGDTVSGAARCLRHGPPWGSPGLLVGSVRNCYGFGFGAALGLAAVGFAAAGAAEAAVGFAAS